MKYKLITLCVLLLAGVGVLHAQQVYKYWVSFTDKAHSPYTLDNPSSYLSHRALLRRQRQNIAFDSLDLPVSPSYVSRLKQAGFGILFQSKWFNGVAVYLPDSVGPEAFSQFPFVASVVLYDHTSLLQPDTILSETGFSLPYNPSPTPFSSQYYGGGFTQINQLNGQFLHAQGYEGQGIIIGMNDTGFPGVDNANTFAALRDEGRLLATRDFVWPVENNVFSLHSHGTHTLSTIATLMPGFYVGTAPLASFVLCRTENTFSETPLEEYSWVAAAEYLDSLGADIISSSLGYYEFDDTACSYTLSDLDGRTAIISRGAATAVGRGMLVVTSAGNDGFANPQHLGVPADVPEVLSVGAVDDDGIVSFFSSHGPTAAGVVKPDVLALGQRVISATPYGRYQRTDGTSLSCPIMAGMMACLWQRYPGLTPRQLCDSVRAWGSMASAPDSLGGYGIPDFSKALRQGGLDVKSSSEADFLLYPNPVGRQQTVSLVYESIGSHLAVFDAWGREVLSRKVGQGPVTFSTQALAPGVYHVVLTTARGVASRRLVVE